MESKSRELKNLEDLPSYRPSYSERLREMDITSIDDLRAALMNETMTTSIDSIPGVGPGTISAWKKAIAVGPGFDETSTSSPEEELREDGSDEEAQEVSDAEAGEANAEIQVGSETNPPESENEEVPIESSHEVPEPTLEPLNLTCGMDELDKVKRTLVNLLEWDSAKKRGLTSSVKYVVRKLEGAGMEVSVMKEDTTPIIVASKGQNGLVLWGNLDTHDKDGMNGKLQGVVSEGLVYGRGAANKGAVAVLLTAARRMATWNVPFSIVLTTDALGDQKGAEEIAPSSLITESRGVLLLAPTKMNLISCQAGYVDSKVKILGEESILSAAEFLTKLKERSDELAGDQPLKVSMIRGGRRKDPFGSSKSCQVALEVLTSQSTADVECSMHDALSGHQYQLEVLRRSEPLQFNLDSPLAKTLMEIVGGKARFDKVDTEAGKLLPHFQNVLVFGPGDTGISTSTMEFVSMRDLERAYETLLKIVEFSDNIPVSD